MMPLTQKITFKVPVQKANRMRVPKLIRCQLKMEKDQLLKIGAKVIGLGKGWQFFYAKMAKDGRINIPKLTMALLQAEKENLEGYVLEVTIEPA